MKTHNFEVILSTSNERIFSVKFANYQGCDVIIVHQVYNDSSVFTEYPDFPVGRSRYIRLNFPGLSKSRNAGLIESIEKYAYIMDDDVDFDPKKIAELVNWMERNNVDVATCRFEFEDGAYPCNYAKKPFKHTLLSAAKVSSIEICMNVEKIREKNICFDERFGLGTNLPSGEEYIFLTDCIKSGLNVWFFPITIGVHPNITSGMDFYTSFNKILAKRDMLKRVFGWKSFLFIFLFWLKKLPKVMKSGFMWPFTKAMLLGLR